MKKFKIAIIFATVYLLVYVLLIQINFDYAFIFIMFSFSPVVLVYMVYQILKNGRYLGKELGANEAYGYQDVDKNTLGTF